MLQQQITSNLPFQAVTLIHSYFQENLNFYTDYVHRNHSFPEVPQKHKLSAHFPPPFKSSVKYHFLHVQKLMQKTTEHCKVTKFTPEKGRGGGGGGVVCRVVKDIEKKDQGIKAKTPHCVRPKNIHSERTITQLCRRI